VDYRVVLDTNVLLSAIFFGGPPRLVLEAAIQGDYTLCLSESLIEEFRGVLCRPKFYFNTKEIETIIAELLGIAELAEPTRRIRVVKNYPDDDRVIECALTAEANFIVTGDNHLLQLKQYSGIQLINPEHFLKVLLERRK
jgi:putative PIN family toxin of toxin-antitoxin system